MKKTIITMLLLAATSTAFANQTANGKQQPSPEEMKQIMEMSMGAMVPMMGKMTEVMIEAQLIIAEKPETARRMAAFKKNLYTELLKQGFSKKEAFEIMLNTSSPAAMPGMK
ncbi:MAG TPA: hypothetical protein PLN25_00755 [Deltaproteobacteria bacterium]|nr:hypothetical protein [Deltaproteobacteria bacterium]HQB38322.1 hypothetical protein [Deltaproteobacteria bacterium]